MKIFMLTVSNTDGDAGTVVNEAFTSERKARTYLARYVRAAWEEQGHETKLPKANGKAVTRFFGFWDAEMNYSIEAKTLDPAD
jgi:hypothetical protein